MARLEKSGHQMARLVTLLDLDEEVNNNRFLEKLVSTSKGH